eukprot:CAMPEP_0113728234 /NCGR_PEP_ID=MMETSP0038_2-20120614/41750_1 /TAXON_ID=2898 /ORGANISM="Cryptomonas paramecium" /LENGTH=207 /DNA_ID=CAMNT_0000659681 /DNA_START=656 /DNA_END=1275 /DNA_ORIENTATION=+ /assembly_acc=CAM_ASM_000170
MNEWGKQILINCGWKEGCGLGVNQDGDKEPVVTRLKLDRFQSIAHNSSSLTIGARACVGDKNGRHILVEEAGTMLNSTTAAPKRLKLRTTPKPWDGNPLSPCCRFNSSHKMSMRKLLSHEKKCPSNPRNSKILRLKKSNSHSVKAAIPNEAVQSSESLSIPAACTDCPPSRSTRCGMRDGFHWTNEMDDEEPPTFRFTRTREVPDGR